MVAGVFVLRYKRKKTITTTMVKKKGQACISEQNIFIFFFLKILPPLPMFAKYMNMILGIQF